MQNCLFKGKKKSSQHYNIVFVVVVLNKTAKRFEP